MYSRYGLTSSNFTLGPLAIKQAIVNARKTSEVVKSEIQLNKMTNLLKDMNNENDLLAKQLVQLTDENKELKKVISNRDKNKSTLNEANLQKQYSTQFNKPEQSKPVAIDYSTFNKTNNRIDFDYSQFQPFSARTQGYQSTQTSPPKTINRPITTQIGVSTSRTPEKYIQLHHNDNPQTIRSMKKQRTASLHRLTPSNTIKIKEFPVGSLRPSNSLKQSPKRQNNLMERNQQNSNKKRYLSLISLKK